MAASYRRALARRGEMVTLQRINGTAPRTSLVSARVRAIVTGALPDVRDATRAGTGAGVPGAFTESGRRVLLLAEDLRTARFPLPVLKDDRVLLASGDTLNVEDVDANKGRRAGAIELTVSGTA